MSACVVVGAWLLVDSPRAAGRSEAVLDALAGAPGKRPMWRATLRYAPRLVLNLAVLGAAVRAAVQVYQFFNGSQSLIVALCGFLVALLLCKLFEHKSPRNITQVMVLSLLVIVASTMFSSDSLGYFLILASYFLVLCYLVVLLNLMLETQRLAELSMPAHAPVSAEGVVRKGRPAHVSLLLRDLGNVARHCVFLMAPIAVIVFLAVPRSRGNPFLTSNWGQLGPQQTGFSDVLQFRDYTQLSQSDRVVMRVKFTRDGEDAAADFSDLYFRGQVLQEYSPPPRDLWTHGPYLAPNQTPPPAGTSNGIGVHYTLQDPGPCLFILGPSAVWDREQQFTYNANEMTLTDNMSAVRGSGPFSYDAIWFPGLILPTAPPEAIAPGEMRAARDVSDGTPNGKRHIPAVLVSPQIVAKAREILASGLGDAAPAPGQAIPPERMRQVANMLSMYLRGNYPYSLSFHKVDMNLDNTTDFLVNRGIKGSNTGGHCECFASAMVMLCRAVGLNARIVHGYHGGEYDTLAKELLVREKYAHAWTEVYIPDQGWVTYDPSPISGGTDTAAASGHFFADALAMLQSIWSATIVNFDNDSREAMANWFSARLDQMLAVVRIPDWTNILAWVALGPMVMLLVYLRRRFRRLRLREGNGNGAHGHGRHSTPLGFLDDLLHLFARGGERRADLTPQEFLTPHLAGLGAAEADARFLIQTAYGVRFGGLQVTAELRQRIGQALKQVKAARATPEVKQGRGTTSHS